LLAVIFVTDYKTITLRRLAGVSEGEAEREPAAEILSAAKDLELRFLAQSRTPTVGSKMVGPSRRF